ncbi:hypothetical protein GCM10011403_26740 [Pseudohongiella nitratireducens]|jgi:hypothetical protein|uniref:Uncharacterized protein n=1 Tax=Pseudohongiella nitratireducens TaxID=1768907 RepID=A0A916VKJ7_9GAMM|nr:hypothetical protein [Pseudohongiella nitratireducens]MDF1624482.1 hypothetical protein [Pseudohongiella nitratireducens]GFZ81941.1 hypothetical protein GCM10011403_26740 [Pseudohongiella nitratireducens]|tara:strand:+ start:2980 stop:3465 length:486 start_codon:yes stop_codon:yes gene_type:complete
MSKPVILVYDLDHTLVDRVAVQVGNTGQYTTINTYNESHAQDAIRQYDQGFGFFSNQLACLITGWNNHLRPREQLLFKLREKEKRSPFRRPMPVIIITEDHREDLQRRALDPEQGQVCAYLHADDFEAQLVVILEQLLKKDAAASLNREAWEAFRQGLEED